MEKNPHILMIADSTSVHTRRWIDYFAGRDFRIDLITIGQKRQIVSNARHIINFDRFYYDSPAFLIRLLKTRRLIRDIDPDILHAHFAHQYGWLGALSGFHPFFLTLWGTDILKLPHRSRGKIGLWLTRYCLKKADAISATSEAARDEAVKLGAGIRNTEVIFWGVDSSKFKPDIDCRNLRRALSIADYAQVILSNRNYSALYNNDIVIDAAAKILPRYPEAVLFLQNAGDQQGAEAALKRLAAEKGIMQSVRFLPRFDHDDLPALYAMADIYVSVPSWDAGPVSLKEAMASHCTPIISDLPGPGEWVKHSQNGLVVPVRNVEALASAISDLLENRDRRDRFNRINRDIIVSKGDHAGQMEKAERIYRRLLFERRCK